MTAEIATLDRVRNAAESLRRQDIRVTADRIIELIGGGSKGTVLEHLRTLRDVAPSQIETPTAIFELARGVLADIYRTGREAEAERTRVATERLSSIMADLDAQVAELATENAQLQSQLVERQATLDTLDEANADLERRLAEADATISAMRAAADANRDSAADALRQALGRFETLVSEATAARPQRRNGSNVPKNEAD